jgi:molecular chaperone DnaJ
MAKNYYIILGISPDATLEQIKAAYRSRAREFHPDHFSFDPQPFLDVQEAFSVLSDPARRRAYDRRVREVKVYGMPEPLIPRKPGVEPMKAPREEAGTEEVSLMRSFGTFSPSFDEIFERLWSNFQSLARPKAERIESLSVEILLTPEQARRGGHVRLLVPAQATCPTCGGRGGLGYYECWRCAGEGVIAGDYPLQVSFPPGVRNGHQTILPLDRLGINNFFLVVIFQVSGEEGR